MRDETPLSHTGSVVFPLDTQYRIPHPRPLVPSGKPGSRERVDERGTQDTKLTAPAGRGFEKLWRIQEAYRPELPNHVVTRRCVDYLLGDGELASDALDHLVNICVKAAGGRGKWRPEFKVKGKMSAFNGDSKRGYKRAEGGQDGYGAKRECAVMFVLEFLNPWRGKSPDAIYRAAADDEFRYVAKRFADRWSNFSRDLANRRRLVKWMHPDSSVDAETGEDNAEYVWGTVFEKNQKDGFYVSPLDLDLKAALTNVHAMADDKEKSASDITALLKITVMGFSYHAVARELGVPVETLKTRIYRLRVKLMPLLKTYIRTLKQ
jgi:hypothetical protein